MSDSPNLHFNLNLNFNFRRGSSSLSLGLGSSLSLQKFTASKLSGGVRCARPPANSFNAFGVVRLLYNSQAASQAFKFRAFSTKLRGLQKPKFLANSATSCLP